MAEPQKHASATAGPEAFAAGAGGPRTGRPPPHRHPWLRRLAGALMALALLLVLGLAGIWYWIGTSESLDAVLQRAAAYLPAGQTLQSEGVSGSLRRGGHIDRLFWRNESLSVEAKNIDIGWSLLPIVRKQVQLSKLDVASIVVTPHPHLEAPDEPMQPLEQVTLPIQVDVPFSVAQLVWVGPPTQKIQSLTGRYRYDGTDHHVDLSGVDVVQGSLSGNARLQGAAPMALAVQLQAKLHVPMPEDGPELDVSLSANVTGHLGGKDARLAVDAQLRQAPARTLRQTGTDNRATPAQNERSPEDTAPKGEIGPAMRASATAALAPWARQPLLQADAQLDGINLAALAGNAPRTLLSGTVSAGPSSAGWDVTASLTNAIAGPIDQKALPVTALDAQARWNGIAWTVPEATVEVGGGKVLLQAQFQPAPQTMQATATLTRLNPALLHTRLAAAPVNGTLLAQGSLQDLQFSAQLAAASETRGARTLKPGTEPLRIERIAAQGRWKDHVLTLPKAEIQALNARVSASDVRVVMQPALVINGTLMASAPGASLSASGRMAEKAGEGKLDVQLSAAQETLAWIRSLPVLEELAPGLAARGSATLSAQWQGGWGTLATLPASADSAASGPAKPRIRARLDSARLQLDIPQGEGVGVLKTDLRNLKVTAVGDASRADIALNGQLREGKRSIDLQTILVASMHRPAPDTAFVAQAHISELHLRALDGVHDGAWSLKLSAPFSVDFTKAKDGAVIANASGASAVVTAPVPGKVGLQWEPILFKQTSAGATRVSSRGALSGVPLAWSDLAAGAKESPLKKFGLHTNLVFGGQWNVHAADSLSAKVQLQRSSGDLRIATEAAAPATSIVSTGAAPKAQATPREFASTISAGVRSIELSLNASGEEVSADFLWNSERAGTIYAQAKTRLEKRDGGWTWPEDATLAGKVRAQLPQVGVWSVLAPPGWRVSGTLDADVALSGSRSDPRWKGELKADELSVQSLLDGVDLRNGHLSARLTGNRLEVTEFRLEGGKGNSSRIPGFSGNLTASPTDGGTLQGSGMVQWGDAGSAGSAASALRMNFTARARSLQVLGRADRQASVSGTLQASLLERQFKLRGDLIIDRASILLPEAGAPRLGDDVVVRSAASDKAAQQQVQEAAKAANRTETVLPPDVAISLDLGNDFALQGLGITTRLEGQLRIRSRKEVGAPPLVEGEVRTVAGRYRAWGQMLDVETGLIRFNGAYDNPSLDILALRPNIDVRAGVQVTGNAKNPRVRLYSEPDLPDAEKLSWVVLGRNAAGGGAEAALLQQAALALLGGKSGGGAGTSAASKLGLDEIGFKGPGAGADASGAALTFGKRISKDLYVTYERSLSGTLGTLYIFYDLTKRLRLRGQTGADNGLDLIYTVRYE